MSDRITEEQAMRDLIDSLITRADLMNISQEIFLSGVVNICIATLQSGMEPEHDTATVEVLAEGISYTLTLTREPQ